MASIINTGVSALNAFKRQLETTGHNIANVNTAGYSRQTVQLDARLPQAIPQGYIGSGVEVASIRRNYDSYLSSRVRDYTSSREEFSVYSERANQIDNVVADAASGIDDMMQKFFASVNDMADDPTSIPARTVMINRASQLSDRFQSLDGWFGDMRQRLNQDLGQQVSEVNSLAESIARVNVQARTLAGASGEAPNDVLDERDKLIDKLSNYTNVSTVEQRDGTMNVFVGTGQALVVGTSHNTLALADNPLSAQDKELVIQQAGGLQVNVTNQMTGGSIGGLTRFRDEVLDETQNALGRVAIGLATNFNAEHQTGMDLDGELGDDFFAVAAPEVQAGTTNGGSISVGFDDVAKLTTHDYRLDYDGSSWALTDLESGGGVALSGSGTAADPFVADGMRIVVNASAAGDTYLLRPTRLGAAQIGLKIADERDIAAAEVINASANVGNSGTGSISAGALSSRSGNTKLPTPPGIVLSFQAGNQLGLSSAPPGTVFVDTNGAPLGANAAFVAGQTYRVNVPGLGTYDVRMSGAPAVGDTFELADNTGGVGDNRNARRLADLQSANLMMDGTASLADTYGALISDVGTKTQQAATNADLQGQLLSQAEAAKAEVSGVNLDEEAADLVRFQQAYQAAAQVINVANSLFDSLLSAVRR